MNSDESGDFGNPRSLVVGLPSGRPPDSFSGATSLDRSNEKSEQHIQRICSETLLERAGFPLSADLQGQCKKLRGSGMQSPTGVAESMEVEDSGRNLDSSVEGLNGKVGSSPTDQTQMVVDGQGAIRMSYASVVGSATRATSENREDVGEWGCDPNKEACVGNRSKENRPMEDSTTIANVNVPSKDAARDSNLFGPWMIVENHRKRLSSGGPSSSRGPSKQTTENVVNRFAVLERESGEAVKEQRIESGGDMANEQGEEALERVDRNSTVVTTKIHKAVPKNAAYRTSNLEKKNKKNRQVFEKAVIIPMVEGQSVSMVEHTPQGGNKVHAAVSLFEKGHGRGGSDGIVLGKTRGGRKGTKDVSHPGLKVRKPPDTRTIARPVLNEWVDNMNMQMSNIAARSESTCGSTHALVNQDGALEPVVSGDASSEIRTIVPAAGLGIEGKGSFRITSFRTRFLSLQWLMRMAIRSGNFSVIICLLQFYCGLRQFKDPNHHFLWIRLVGSYEMIEVNSATAVAVSRQQLTQLPGSNSSSGTSSFWIPPEDGWLKLNADGARASLDGRASCGGVLRDHNGSWIRGFSKFIGRCSVVEAELWGIAVGMELAWSMGCRQLIVELDSSDALRMLQQCSSEVCSYIIGSHIHQLCREDWQVVFSKVVQCNNGVADGLAKLASNSSFDVLLFDEPPGRIETG
ncbi:hypothetical protein V6N13_078964 [Hibiscus sabdariffa]